jgi:hypothetical protein
VTLYSDLHSNLYWANNGALVGGDSHDEHVSISISSLYIVALYVVIFAGEQLPLSGMLC